MFLDIGRVPRAHSDTNTERAGHTVFLPDKRNTALNPRKGWRGKRTSSSQPFAAVRQLHSKNRIWFVKGKENITLPPRCSQVVAGKLETEEQTLPPLVCAEPTQIPVVGIFPARALTRFGTSAHPNFQVTSQRSHAVSELFKCAYGMLAKFLKN